ncbi:MAG: glycosyltransferase family 2 protein [Paludibacteraceae bacterium]
MKLSIITINYNNREGLIKTMASVGGQTVDVFEYIVVDGASTDGSVDEIEKWKMQNKKDIRFRFVSEKDKGIYDAMNKGIGMATGEYVEFLNSGDCLYSDDVVERMLPFLSADQGVSIFYGNMMKRMPKTILRDRSFNGAEITLLGMFTGTLNHSPAYIRRSLFDKYGGYDTSLKIVSDWKWYLKSIILGGEKVLYVDLDITLFDMNGISNTNRDLDRGERTLVLSEMFPPAVLKDYEQWAFPISQMKRLQRYGWAYRLVWFLERCLFQLDKRRQKDQIAR